MASEKAVLILPWPPSDKGTRTTEGQETSNLMEEGSRVQDTSPQLDQGSRVEEISSLVDKGSKVQEISLLADQGSREQEIRTSRDPGLKQLMGHTAGCAIPGGSPERSTLRIVWETLLALSSPTMIGTG